MHELLERVYHLLRSEAPEGVTVDRDYDPSLPPLTVDPNHIIQAMLNLGRNAIQALSGGGVQSPRLILRTRAASNVSVGAQRHRLVASIQFEDNGPGVLAGNSRHDFLSAGVRARRRHRAWASASRRIWSAATAA